MNPATCFISCKPTPLKTPEPTPSTIPEKADSTLAALDRKRPSKNAESLSFGDMERTDRKRSLKGVPGRFGSTSIVNHASASARRCAFPNGDFSFVPR